MGVAKAPLWQGPDSEVDQIFCGKNAADTQYPQPWFAGVGDCKLAEHQPGNRVPPLGLSRKRSDPAQKAMLTLTLCECLAVGRTSSRPQVIQQDIHDALMVCRARSNSGWRNRT